MHHPFAAIPNPPAGSHSSTASAPLAFARDASQPDLRKPSPGIPSASACTTRYRNMSPAEPRPPSSEPPLDNPASSNSDAAQRPALRPDSGSERLQASAPYPQAEDSLAS